jgi:hypothetical protein
LEEVAWRAGQWFTRYLKGIPSPSSSDGKEFAKSCSREGAYFLSAEPTSLTAFSRHRQGSAY